MSDFLRKRETFNIWVVDRLRATDIDHQGHINNTIHAVLCSNGRFDFLRRNVLPHVKMEDMFALAKITIEYLGEMHYPGEVHVGTLVRKVGRSSVTLGQGLFNEGKCVAVAESVMVLLDPVTRRAKPWPSLAAQTLSKFTLAAGHVPVGEI